MFEYVRIALLVIPTCILVIILLLIILFGLIQRVELETTITVM